MIHPRIDELLEQVDSRYALVIVAAKRARQINNYHHQLGEGTFDEFAPPLIQSRSKNYLTMALEETAEGKIVYQYTAEEYGDRSGEAGTVMTQTATPAHFRREPDPARSDRRDRRLQGVRADAPAREAGSRRHPARHAGGAALRRRGDVPGIGAPARRATTSIEHLTRADLLVVAPCTANTLAKLAYGIADNVLTEAALAHRGPLLVAPAMNPRMWANAATRANVDTLVARGVELVGPDEGEMAEGEWGVGRLAEPEEIAARVAQLLAPGSLAGRRVLVTAGGTREPLDSVRYLGNRSSGRMGIALAEEARRRGAEVILLAANLALPAPHGVETIPTPTADAMRDAALALPDVDVLLLAAAVADYRPTEALAGKRPKDARGWTLELAPTDDIARCWRAEARRAGAGRVRRRARRRGPGAEAADARDEERRPRRLQRRRPRRHRFDAAENEVVLMTRER